MNRQRPSVVLDATRLAIAEYGRSEPVWAHLDKHRWEKSDLYDGVSLALQDPREFTRLIRFPLILAGEKLQFSREGRVWVPVWVQSRARITLQLFELEGGWTSDAWVLWAERPRF